MLEMPRILRPACLCVPLGAPDGHLSEHRHLLAEDLDAVLQRLDVASLLLVALDGARELLLGSRQVPFEPIVELARLLVPFLQLEKLDVQFADPLLGHDSVCPVPGRPLLGLEHPPFQLDGVHSALPFVAGRRIRGISCQASRCKGLSWQLVSSSNTGVILLCVAAWYTAR